MPDADDIKLALSKIDDRLEQDPGADEKKQLLATKTALALELSEIAEEGLDAGAIAVAAASKKLEAVIASAGTLPFAQYWQDLQKALAGVNTAIKQS